MNNLTHRIFSCVAEIPKKDWDQIWPDKYQGYNYYLCMERSIEPDIQFYFCGIYHDDKILLLSPLFMHDFDLSIAVDEPALSRIIKLIRKVWPRFLKIKTLSGGSPVAHKGVLALAPNTDFHKPALIKFNEIMHEMAKEKNARMLMFKDFDELDLNNFKPLFELGYIKANGLPNTGLEITFSSINEYLSGLSYMTRKEIHRKIKKSEKDGKLSTEVIKDGSIYADRLHQLYMNTFLKSPMKMETVTKDLFKNTAQYIPEETFFFLYKVDNEIIGFNYCHVKDDWFMDQLIGFDYPICKKYNLYFYSLINNIKWCLNNGIKYYALGQTLHDIKLRLGYKLNVLFYLVKPLNPSMHWLIKTLIPLLEVNPTKNEN